ncbi:MAG TPA: DinB family protein [Thermoanaerobaculia bacterium]|nr:DinB family protein [Thermoanaerobaculia bacterium]
MRPTPDDYAQGFAGYVSLVPEDDILGVLEEQSAETQKLLTSLDDAKAAHRYAEGKWSVKEVVGHVIDAERIFAYRALAIGRGETQALPGFDENEYVLNAGFDAWRIGDLAEQYALVRKSSIVMYRNFPEDAWARRGNSNGKPILAAALAWITVGHERHHVKILRERYGM